MKTQPRPRTSFPRALRRVLVGPDLPPAPAIGTRWRQVIAYGGPPVLFGVTTIVAQTSSSGWDLQLGTVWLLAILSVAPAQIVAFRPVAAWRLWMVATMAGLYAAIGAPTAPWNVASLIVGLLVLGTILIRAERETLFAFGILTVVPLLLLSTMVRPELVNGILAGGVTYGFAVLLRNSYRAERALVAHAQVSEQARADRAVLEERTRIAREMHDVVAHHMSMIAVRAETAPYRLDGLSEPVSSEFVQLAEAAREALTDMRRLLGVLRSPDGPPELAPQPGLDLLDELVDGARRAGMRLHYLPPEPAEIARAPEPVALAGYRIVQEAMANAARHAAGAPVTVQVLPGHRELAVRVYNAAAPGGPPAENPEGHGLTGMRERAVLLGGDFTAGPTADGGYAVRASLPYDQPGDEEVRQ
ncbi:histidine kinase [Actinoplanes sp. NPDC051346]|uniref:sensor histidine kinase n=1 Tax=Actinoplanes sp. NPDC051346 TaxID=3155048 RepID=UPI00342D82E4